MADVTKLAAFAKHVNCRHTNVYTLGQPCDCGLAKAELKLHRFYERRNKA